MLNLKSVYLIGLLLFVQFSFAQNPTFNYSGRTSPAISKQQLAKATVIAHVMPNLWRSIWLAYKERVELDFILNYYAGTGYRSFVYLTTVEIEVVRNNERIVASSNNAFLTKAQQELLAQAPLGTEITIRIQYDYNSNREMVDNKLVKQGHYTVLVVPFKEAQYPGGFQAFTEYVNANVFAKRPADLDNKIQWPATVDFLVDAQGQTQELEISGDNLILNQLIINAFDKMPAWQPAQNALGEKQSQHFSIPFMLGC